jgi:digeranylgeranylglycerophospholipid reductase
LNYIPERTDIEVIVVGAGPGGALAARALREEGREVLILEKQTEVAKTVLCAEGISHESVSLFISPNNQPWVSAKLRRAKLFGPNGSYFEVRRNNLGYVLERRIFDKHLLTMALEKGAELMTSTSFISARRTTKGIEVEIRNNGKVKRIRTKLLIGADGAGSRVGRSLGMEVGVGVRDVHFCAQYLLYHPAVEKDCVSFFVGEKIAPGGYGWIFPKGNGLANVGVGVVRDVNNIKKYLDNLVESYLNGARILGFIRGVVPVGGHRLRLVDDNVMLVGDAARLAEPISGAGIAAAMVSGDIAGHVGGKALRRGRVRGIELSPYEDELWKGRKREYDFSYRVRELIMEFDDHRLNLLVEELGNIFNNKELDDFNPFKLSQMAMRSKVLRKLILKVGRDVLGKYLKEVVFGS